MGEINKNLASKEWNKPLEGVVEGVEALLILLTEILLFHRRMML